jgi:hypothetical protein
VRLPEIRYPLFWLAGALLLLIGWRVAWPLTAELRGAIQRHWTRAVEGPPVPHSDVPQRLSGVMPRRVLLLQEDLPATDRPDGRVVETIGRRLFAEVYDVWPTSGEPTHYRIGTRNPIGWVPAGAVLPWSTRLVAASDDAPPEPVVGHDASGLQVVRWAEGAAWSQPGRRESIPADAPGLGVLLSRDELAILLRRLIAGEEAETLRDRAILGQLADRASWSEADLAELRRVLPSVAVARHAASREEAAAALARINREAPTAAAWNGLEFRVVPLEDLP